MLRRQRMRKILREKMRWGKEGREWTERERVAMENITKSEKKIEMIDYRGKDSRRRNKVDGGVTWLR